MEEAESTLQRLNSLLTTYKIPIGLTLVGSVLIIGGFLSSAKPKITYPKESIISGSSNIKGIATTSELKVDIAGAIKKAGVITLPRDSRLEDVIKAAGGFSSDADFEYISKKLNLSQKISDGMKIYVPKVGESGGGILSAASGKVGINSATSEQLEKLPGIGQVSADKIISKRPFNSVDDLLTKKAVSKAVFEKIKELIDIN